MRGGHPNQARDRCFFGPPDRNRLSRANEEADILGSPVKSNGALDPEIREALKNALRQADPSAAIIEELPLLRGRGRADLAFVNGRLCGFEIKSDADSLVRLGTQTEHYQSVFEMVTLVAAGKHLRHARRRVPRCWGLMEVARLDGEIVLRSRRKPRVNRDIDKAAVSRLLWKNECVRMLRKQGICARSGMPVQHLWELIESLPSKVICDEVREALKLRQRRSDSRQIRCDDLRTTAAIG